MSTAFFSHPVISLLTPLLPLSRSSSKFKKGRVPGPSRLGSPHQAGSPAPSVRSFTFLELLLLREADNDPNLSLRYQAMVEKASFFHHPRPFKDPHWQRKKDAKGKPRNLKQVLQAERDRCPRRILESGELGEALGCKRKGLLVNWLSFEEKEGRSSRADLDASSLRSFSDTTLHPPPSLLPPKKYCDITGLVAPYRDPKTTLQFHSKEVYEVLKTLVSRLTSFISTGVCLLLLQDQAELSFCYCSPQPPGADQAYLDIRGKGTAIH